MRELPGPREEREPKIMIAQSEALRQNTAEEADEGRSLFMRLTKTH